MDDSYKLQNPLIRTIQDKFLNLGIEFAEDNRLEVISDSFPKITEQLKYNIKRFTSLLISIRYDAESAAITADNICFKPLLYSLIPRILSSHNPDDILLKLGSKENISYLEEVFISLLPEMVVYLFDETVDMAAGFKTKQENMVAVLIRQMDSSLIETPYAYLREMMESVKEYEQNMNPELSQNVFYKLMFPYYDRVSKSGINLSLVVRQMSDVITNEQRGQSIFTNPDMKEVKAYLDFFSVLEMEASGDSSMFIKRTSEEKANAILTNQGLLLVVLNSLIFNESGAALNFYSHFENSPEIKSFIYNLMGLVRLADDFADMQIDRDLNVINIFLEDFETKEAFIKLSHIEDDSLINFIMIDRSEIKDFSSITYRNIPKELADLYRQLMVDNAGILGKDLIESIKGVILAALVNAEFSDKAMTQITKIFRSAS